MEGSAAQYAGSVGVIIPPPEIRNIIDKTAEYVAQHGSAFEDNIIATQGHNQNFSFLKAGDPYRPYYEQKIAEFTKINTKESTIEEEAENEQIGDLEQQQTNNFLGGNKEKILKRADAEGEQVEVEIENELVQQIENPLFTIELPELVTSMELDIIKHTAQFVAKNGKKFLVSLTEREKANPQFDFLKPTNPLFNFFMSLVTAYQKIIQIEESQLDSIIKSVKNKANILSNATKVFDYLRQKRQQEKKQSELDKEERLLKDSIDWQEFFIAETIDFNDQFTYNPSSQSSQAAISNGNAVVSEVVQPPQEIVPPQVLSATEKQVEQVVPRKEPIVGPVEIPAQIPVVTDDNIKIRMDYQRQKNSGKNEMTKCQICGQLIPVDEYNEHLKIELQDPKYQQIKKEVQNNAKMLSSANDSQIIPILQEMKGLRPDIFGLSAEQFERSSANDTNVQFKPIWDGQSTTMTRTSATVAMLAQQSRRNYEELQKVKGGYSQSAQDEADQYDKLIQTNNELAKLEEGVHLEPEYRWLQQFPGQVTLNIRIPEDIEKNAQLTGQLIKLCFAPINTIAQVKTAISEKIGVDLDQQNLKSTLFKQLKNDKSLAFYNIFNGASLELTLK